MNEDITTLVCLFHHTDQAQAALEDILKAGVPQANVTLIGPGSTIDANHATLAAVNVPERDIAHLLDGIGEGGAVLTVSSISDHVARVEAIFEAHKAGKIDEAEVDDDMSAAALPAGFAGGEAPLAETAVPVLIVEELEADYVTINGEDAVVYSRVIDIVPLDESNIDLSTPAYSEKTEVH